MRNRSDIYQNSNCSLQIWCLLRKCRFIIPEARDISSLQSMLTYIRCTTKGIESRRPPHSNIPASITSDRKHPFFLSSIHESTESDQACTHTTHQLICLRRCRNRLLLLLLNKTLSDREVQQPITARKCISSRFPCVRLHYEFYLRSLSRLFASFS